MSFIISELEAFEMLDVSPSTFLYYKNVGLLNSIVSGKGTEQSYKLSEVLALIQSKHSKWLNNLSGLWLLSRNGEELIFKCKLLLKNLV